MTKTELVARLRDACPGQLRNKEHARIVWTAMVEILHDALAAGEEIPLEGVGKLAIRQRAGYTGRSPITGGPIEVPPKNYVSFRPYPKFKKTLNS